MSTQTNDLNRFQNLSYDEFKKLALDNSLSRNEKIGFPEKYRGGKEAVIFSDISKKLPVLNNSRQKTIIDIGCGCGPLLDLIIDNCKVNQHKLVLLDSSEMLSQIPDNNSISKISGYFPDTPEFLNDYKEKADAVIVYSVFHYIFYHQDIYKFIDRAIELLKSGGHLLIGDIPNSSKRKRFFSSNEGVKFHKEYTNTDTLPDTNQMQIEPSIDDAIMISIMNRYRAAGLEVYILPQESDLPFSNRREDILIIKH